MKMILQWIVLKMCYLIVMGCSSTNFDGYDNYFELNKIKKKYNMGGTFIKYFHNSPYKWDISALLSINSK